MKGHEGSPYDGIIVEYCDPSSGRSVMPNMSFRAQMLRAGEATQPCRDTTSAIYCVIEGKGHTEVGDVRLDWEENDVFVVPNWMWRRHVNEFAGRRGGALFGDRPSDHPAERPVPPAEQE